ncbi:SDR family oxidoreductase [Streptomyces litchfieldiae]|uniref:NAD(P)H-binding protein n=1 Tax=Streptomyces litchfieldiae TaxID=3075543 RepID=A0ABU2MTC6_9ACTN|nr:NAD(P)H-binding protein [Streptomyces sp. DSM 44938]MDT0344785.1 NAD(P)H-binding protein [Streptomyces sp. DSM 44938]
MEPFLVTGGTGKLGRQVVRLLCESEQVVRVLSRRGRAPGSRVPYRTITGDLRTGAGLEDAVRGVGTIVHCATTNGRRDIVATRNLIDAAVSAGGTPHLVYVSIVGVDIIPLPYYRAKLAAEKLVADSGLPWTVQRITQFHDLLAAVFAYQRRLPLTLALKRFRFQPIDTRDAAARLVDLALGTPAGRAPDIGGPQVRDMRDLAAAYHRAHGRRRRIVSLCLPGRTARGFADGGNLVPENKLGSITFEDFVTKR